MRLAGDGRYWALAYGRGHRRTECGSRCETRSPYERLPFRAMRHGGATVSLIDHDVCEFMAEHLIEERGRGQEARRVEGDLRTFRAAETKRGAQPGGPAELHLGSQLRLMPQCRIPVKGGVEHWVEWRSYRGEALGHFEGGALHG